MKVLFAAVFLLVDLLLLLSFFRAKKGGGQTSSCLSDVIVAASIAVLSHVFITITESQSIATISYAFFYGSINWILILFLRFCFSYTSFMKEARNSRVLLQSVLMLVTALDSIMFLINATSGLAFVCTSINWNGVGPFFITEKI